MTDEIGRRLDAALATAREAGAMLLERFRAAATGRVEYKGVRDIVTEADRASERLIVERLRAAFPDDAVVCEEGTTAEGAAGTWYVDPLDGTVNFAHRYPTWAVSIGWARGGRPEVGVVFDPCRGEVFAARRGAPPPSGAVALALAPDASLDRTIVLTGLAMFRGGSLDRRAFDVLAEIILATEGLRRAGSAALDLAYVAAGRAGGFYEWGLKPWDVCAGGLLVEAAGGVVTDVEGGDGWLAGGAVVAATPAIHPPLLARVRAGR